MVGYLFLFIALLAGSTKGYCGKRTSVYVSEYKDALLANFIRMVFCIIIGFVMILAQGEVSELALRPEIMLITVLSGVTTSAFVVLWLISVRRGAYMMLDVFLMLGVIVPLVLSSVFFDEKIRINQWLGLVVLLIAVFIMCSYNNSIKKKINSASLMLLILCGLSNGLTDFSQKLFIKKSSSAAVFNFYTYVFSALVLLVFYIIAKMGDKGGTTSGFEVVREVGGYILVMSVCLFANSFFKTLAAGILPSAKLYPLNQGAALILSAFMSSVLFKEKLTLRCVAGIALSFAGLIIINVL